MENKNEVSPSRLARTAADYVEMAQEKTGLSLIELSAVFRMAAAACDEVGAMHERAKMTAKISGWMPGK